MCHLLISEFDCGSPDKLANAHMHFNGTKIGCVANYTCVEGTEDAEGGSGEDQMQCTASGWGKVSLKCTGSYCMGVICILERVRIQKYNE